MNREELTQILRNVFSEYGMIFVLLALIVFFSLITISEEETVGKSAATELAGEIDGEGENQRVMIVTGIGEEDREMSISLEEKLKALGHQVVKVINGDPPMAGQAFRELEENNQELDFIATTKGVATWAVIEKAANKYSIASKAQISKPSSGKYPRFLKRDNLRNIADRISVIAILAIGMTLVIITAGLDLSVGSLIAL